MKSILFAIGFSLIVPRFAFTNAGITGNQNKTTAPLAPCMWLYAEHDNVTSNDIISIRVTNVATSAVSNFGSMFPSDPPKFLLNGDCGLYNFRIIVSAGSTYSTVGVRTCSGTVLASESVCCQDGIIVDLNNVDLSSVVGGAGCYEVFLH